MPNRFWVKMLSAAGLFFLCLTSWVGAEEPAGAVNEARLVAQYNYSIHILAMLVVGFGFLMVFVRRYGFGATTGTYLVVATGLPLYMFLRANGVVGHELKAHSVDALLYAEFSVATALIAMGAVLGRLRVANLMFAVAATRGLLSIASALTSFYPVVTTLLARYVLRERLRPVQWAGVALALVGVALITSGSTA